MFLRLTCPLVPWQAKACEVVAGAESSAHAVPRRGMGLKRVYRPRAARLLLLLLLPVREAVIRPAAVRCGGEAGPLPAAGVAVEAAVPPAVDARRQVVAALGQQRAVHLWASRRGSCTQ